MGARSRSRPMSSRAGSGPWSSTTRTRISVRAGDALMDGAVNPNDILKINSEEELARYLVDEVQEVYRLQGVKINDKHIEVIVRQMLRRVNIKTVGDTEFLTDEMVDRWR